MSHDPVLPPCSLTIRVNGSRWARTSCDICTGPSNHHAITETSRSPAFESAKALPLQQSENSKQKPKTEDTTASIQGSRLLGIRPSISGCRVRAGRPAPTMSLPGIQCDVVAAGVPARRGCPVGYHFTLHPSNFKLTPHPTPHPNTARCESERRRRGNQPRWRQLRRRFPG